MNPEKDESAPFPREREKPFCRNVVNGMRKVLVKSSKKIKGKRKGRPRTWNHHLICERVCIDVRECSVKEGLLMWHEENKGKEDKIRGVF